MPFKTFVGIPPHLPPDVSPQPVVKHTDLSVGGGLEGKHGVGLEHYVCIQFNPKMGFVL